MVHLEADLTEKRIKNLRGYIDENYKDEPIEELSDKFSPIEDEKRYAFAAETINNYFNSILKDFPTEKFLENYDTVILPLKDACCNELKQYLENYEFKENAMDIFSKKLNSLVEDYKEEVIDIMSQMKAGEENISKCVEKCYLESKDLINKNYPKEGVFVKKAYIASCIIKETFLLAMDSVYSEDKKERPTEGEISELIGLYTKFFAQYLKNLKDKDEITRGFKKNLISAMNVYKRLDRKPPECMYI